MFTQNLRRGVKNIVQKRLGFREKFRWRKVGEILDTFGGHAHDNTSHRAAQHLTQAGYFIAIAMFSRGLGALREEGSHSRVGQWGARWGTPGSAVGNPGERGGEHRGARWGARWRNTERLTQHHRAGNLRWIRWNVSARIRHNHMRHIKVGRPGLPARPTSSAVCVRRQSLSLRLSQRRS